MSLRGIKPNIEKTLSLLAGRMRHLETLERAAGGPAAHPLDPSLGPHTPTLWQIRSPSDFAPSATNGLVEAIADLGGFDGVVYLPPANYPIGANYTVPANAHLVFAKGAYCTVANGITLTIDGTIEAGLYQIFSWTGTGAVRLTLVRRVYPQWWGATGDGVTDDTDSIQAAMYTVYNGGLGAGLGAGTVSFPTPPGGFYLVSQRHDGAYAGALRWPPNVNLLGTGRRCQIRGVVPDAASGFGIITRLPGVELHTQFMRGFTLFYEGMQSNPNATESNAIWLRGAPDCNHLTFQDLWLQDAYTGFLDESGAWGNVFINVIPYHSRYGFRKTGTGTGYTFIECYPKGTKNQAPYPAGWDIRAWSMEAKVEGASWISCAFDDWVTNEVFLLRDQVGFFIAGMQFEFITATNPGGGASIFRFEKVSHDLIGHIQGLVPFDCFLGLPAEAGDGSIVSFDGGGHVSLDSSNLPAGANVTSRKLGDVYTVSINGTEVTCRAGRLKNVPGTGAIRGIKLDGPGSELTIDRVDYDLITNPNNRKVVVMDEISVGVANSGGVAFRLLRVPNAPDTRDGPLP